MKLSKFFPVFAACLLLSFGSAWAKKQILLAKEDGVKIYQNKVRQLYEKPIHEARRDEYMEVVDASDRDLYQIKLSNGKTGWVEKRLVAERKAGKENVAYTFDDAEVQGYLDNPQAVYILDMTDPSFKPIKLDKSFADDLEKNVDREKSEESHDMYRPVGGGK